MIGESNGLQSYKMNMQYTILKLAILRKSKNFHTHKE